MKHNFINYNGQHLVQLKDNNVVPSVNCDKDGNVIGGDVYLQDQHTPIVNFFFKRLLGLTTLSSNSTVNSNEITLTAGHGVVTGNYLSLLEGDRAYQGKVLNVATNVISLDSPLDYAYTIGAIVRNTTIDMNVNGGVTPIVFDIVPSSGNKWHIKELTFMIEDADIMDTAKFGGISGLTKGIIVRRKDGYYYNMCNIKSNGDFSARGYDVQYYDKAPSGVYGMLAKKSFNPEFLRS